MDIQAVIDRLNKIEILSGDETIEIIAALENHRDVEIAQRLMLDEIDEALKSHRRAQELPLWATEGITNIADNARDLLDTLEKRLTITTEDAAGLREIVKTMRNMAREGEDNPREAGKLLDRIDYHASEALKEYRTGEARRKEWEQLEVLVDRFETAMQRDGGWRYGGDRTLAERVQRCVDHYTRLAADTVSKSMTFKEGMVSWMRGIAINAQAVSWAHTHHEKDARLRGLIEVIETAISQIDELRLDDRMTQWSGAVDSWLKSDFPTREMRNRILDMEQEIRRLKAKASEDVQDGVTPEF